MSRNRVGFLILVSLGMWGCAGEPPPDQQPVTSQTFGLRSTAGPDRADLARRAGELNAFLVRERPAGVMITPAVARVTDADLRSLDDASGEPGLMKVGLSKALARPAAFGRAQRHGAFARTADGGFVWAVAVRSPGASAMRLQFANVRLPDDADLYVYNELGDARGPYHGMGPSGSGTFWSHTLAGDTLIAQVRYFGRATEAEIDATSVDITAVGHLTPRFGVVASPESFCSSPDENAACVEDASCYNVSAVADAKSADALLLWPQGPYFYICSGGLLADAAGSETPFFLTAHHCIHRARDAANLEAHFGFKTDHCSNSYPTQCPDWRKLSGGVLGSTILATSSSGDFSLLQLSGAPPAGTTFLGWTSAPVAEVDGATLHRISHPNAAPQAYSRHQVDTSAPTCSSIPRGSFIYSRDVVGATEGGSSGSPVVNGAGQVVGQLYGACGTDTGNVCASDKNATVDGAFAFYWPQVQPFLAPGSSGNEVCDDGVDNDGDGLVDCADPDCASDPACDTGTCDLGQKFDPCDVDADCCSNKCRGPSSKRSCR